MAGTKITKINAAVVTGPGKGARTLRIKLNAVTGPPAGTRVGRVKAHFVSGPKGGRVSMNTGAAVIRLPTGGITYLNSGAAVVRPPAGGITYLNSGAAVFALPYQLPRVFKNSAHAVLFYVPRFIERKVTGYSAIQIVLFAGKLRKVASYVAISIPLAKVRKVQKYSVLNPRPGLFPRKLTAYIAVRPLLVRLNSFQGYSVLKIITTQTRVYQLQKFAILKVAPPVTHFKLAQYVAIFPAPPVDVYGLAGYVIIKEPVGKVKKVLAYAAFAVKRVLLPKVNRYSVLAPRPPTMFFRKGTAFAAIKPPPPHRAYAVSQYVVVSVPPPMLRTKKLIKLCAMQAPPPTKAQIIRGFAVVKPPPPIKSKSISGYAALVKRPTAAITFHYSGFAVLAGLPPRIRKIDAYALLVPLGSIGARPKQMTAFAVLKRPTVSSAPRGPLVNIG